MIQLNYTLLLVVIFCWTTSCQTKTSNASHKTSLWVAQGQAHRFASSGYQSFVLLDSAAAADAIVMDTTEHFFDKINPLEMMIQMKKNYPEGTDRNVLLKDYKQFLRSDVTHFTPQDTVRLKRIMLEACALYNKIEPTAFSYEIRLIKTHGKHYGNGVYYTRENAIIIPANELTSAPTPLNDEILLQTLLHEIAHIYTRLNPRKQAQLFHLIGFKRATSNLLINDSLYKRVFYNPDGIDLGWTMDFKSDDGKMVHALPLIYSKTHSFNPTAPQFMDHMGWSYFEAQPTQAGLDILTVGTRQQSTLNVRELPTHFLQKFNTNYIVHPNEIIADNIKILTFSQKDPRILDNLSEEGRNLLLKVKAVMNQREN